MYKIKKCKYNKHICIFCDIFQNLLRFYNSRLINISKTGNFLLT